MQIGLASGNSIYQYLFLITEKFFSFCYFFIIIIIQKKDK